MNTGRLILALVAAFLFIFVFDWIFHGILLRDIYYATPALWRPQEAMQGYFMWLVLGQLVVALMICFLFATCVRHHNVVAGLWLGLLLGGINAGQTFIVYGVQPIPAKLMAFWIIGGIIELAAIGAIIGAIYRPRTAPLPLA